MSATPVPPSALPAADNLLAAAQLGIFDEAGGVILSFLHETDADAFFRSRMARRAVESRLRLMADAARRLPPDLRAALDKVDWDAWWTLGDALAAGADDAQTRKLIWDAMMELVPASLVWLRRARVARPELFALSL